MNMDSLNRWLVLGANVGVLAGFVVLVLELNQSRNVVRAQTRNDVAMGFITLSSLPAADSQLASVIRRGDAGEYAVSQDEEFSGSGAPVYKHQERGPGWEVPAHEGRNLVDIESPVAKYIGEVETVLHEIASDLIHLDVLYVPAAPGRPYHVLVTSGMSDLAMSVPDGMEKYDRAELLVVLPETWPISDQAIRDESNYWPIRWLKYIGRLPHEYSTWIGWGHTIPNSNPPERIAKSLTSEQANLKVDSANRK